MLFFFLLSTSSRSRHALRCLLWICKFWLYLPQDSVQKVVFFTPLFLHSLHRSRVSVCSQFIRSVRTLIFLRPAYIYIFKSTCPGCILIHLEKTRHLVFSHMTWKNRDLFFPTCPPKIYTSYNLQKQNQKTKQSVIWKVSPGPIASQHICLATSTFCTAGVMADVSDWRSECPKTESFEKRAWKQSGRCHLHHPKIIFSSTCQTQPQ